MKKGICQACYLEGTPLAECMALAQEAGLDGFELIVGRPGESELHAESTAAQLHDVARLARDNRLQLCSMFGSPYTNQFPITSADRDVWAQGVAALERMLEIANGLEIATLLYVPGRVTESIPYEVAYRQALAAIRQAVPKAAALGVTIAVENVGNRFLQSPLEMRDFIAAAESDQVQAYFDVGNLLYLYQGWPEQWLRLLGPLVRQIHVKDVASSSRGQAGVMLLQGDVNWHAVLEACRDIGYDGYLVAEVSAYPHYPRRTPFDVSTAIGVLIEELAQLRASG
ncbi:MAG: sugar phosphate isomerase/epimerase family protein [Anaerolineae bacterium]